MRRLLLPMLLCLAAPALAQAPGPAAPGPASPPASRPDPKRAEVDGLLARLQAAPSEDAAAPIEAQLRRLWLQGGSAAATLLMNRGLRDLSNSAGEEAEADFDAVLALEPELPDAFYRRGLARFALGDYPGALADIESTLQREPRHFAALESLSRIAEARGDFKGALAAWQKSLELSPMTPEGQERLKLLERKAYGEAT